MPEIALQQGDVFVVNSGSRIAKIINVVSGFNSADGQSVYNHAGIITTPSGTTFEALKTINHASLKQYAGCKIMIARPAEHAKDALIKALLRVIMDHEGQSYPWWRLPLFVNNSLARVVSYKGRYVVCSELVARYLLHAGLRHGGYTGTTPDRLADEWRKWRDFEIIYEGEWQ